MMNSKTKILDAKRHGFVTAWLILMIVSNSVSALLYLIGTDFVLQNSSSNLPKSYLLMLGVFCLINIYFSLMLFKWKKWAFWGFLGSSLIVFIFNLYFDVSIMSCFMGLCGIAILYGILQIKKDKIRTWDLLR